MNKEKFVPAFEGYRSSNFTCLFFHLAAVPTPTARFPESFPKICQQPEDNSGGSPPQLESKDNL